LDQVVVSFAMFIAFFFHNMQQKKVETLTGDLSPDKEALNSRRMPRQCH